MAQDTRKDPRAKVLTMTVRYKSATLDEFIEHHSYDISRGGMFIKTPSPFPPGTLLKFEVKIAEDKKLMQGVGRVVWKRESAEAGNDRPAGMGVKFIKVDEDSRKLIGQLVASRGEDTKSQFEVGQESGESRRATPSSASAATSSAAQARKGTMLGLGTAKPPRPESKPPARTEKQDESFFPDTSQDPLPDPEDRTVIRQADELLQDALREAGGSMDEVTAAEKSPAARAEASDSEESEAEGREEEEAAATEKEAEEEQKQPERAKEPSRPAAAAESKRKPEAEEQPSEPRPRPKARRTSSLPASSAIAQETAEEGGGGRGLALLLGAAAAIGLVWYLGRKPETSDEAPQDTAAQHPQAAKPEPEAEQGNPPEESEAAEEAAPKLAGDVKADAAAQPDAGSSDKGVQGKVQPVAPPAPKPAVPKAAAPKAAAPRTWHPPPKPAPKAAAAPAKKPTGEVYDPGLEPIPKAPAKAPAAATTSPAQPKAPPQKAAPKPEPAPEPAEPGMDNPY